MVRPGVRGAWGGRRKWTDEFRIYIIHARVDESERTRTQRTHIHSWLGGYVIDSLCAVEQKRRKKKEEKWEEKKSGGGTENDLRLWVTRLLRGALGQVEGRERGGRIKWHPFFLSFFSFFFFPKPYTFIAGNDVPKNK